MKIGIKLILLLLFIPLVSFSQDQATYGMWNLTQTVDEFGDPTGNGQWFYYGLGKMSNSATTSANATLVVGENNGNLGISILEYDLTNPANFLCDTIEIAVKTPNGTVYRETLAKRQNIGTPAFPVFIGNYEYGGQYIELFKPDKKRMKWIQKNRAKGRVDLNMLFMNSRGEFKLAITCGGSKYNFKLKGFLEKSS